jgi:hypothetical protein
MQYDKMHSVTEYGIPCNLMKLREIVRILKCLAKPLAFKALTVEIK